MTWLKGEPMKAAYPMKERGEEQGDTSDLLFEFIYERVCAPLYLRPRNLEGIYRDLA